MSSKGKGQGHISIHHTIMFQRRQGPGETSLKEDKDSNSPEPQSFQTRGGSSGPLEVRRAGSGKSYFSWPLSCCPGLLEEESEFGLGRNWLTARPSASRASHSGRRAMDITADAYFGRQALGTGAPPPECSLPCPGRLCKQSTGSSMGMSCGTVTAAVGLGYRTPEDLLEVGRPCGGV